MRKISLLLATGLSILLLLTTCNPSDDEGVVIQGEVTNEQTLEPIASALVQITSPDELSDIYSRTDSIGQYSLGGIEIDEVTILEISASAPGFAVLTQSITVTPDDQITGFNFELSTGGGDDDGDDDGDDEPSGPSGGAAAIELVEISNETINIAATGGITSTTFTFEVQDSSGNSLDLNNAIDVQFSIISGPGGGENITPTTAITNNQGLVSAKLNSGNAAGVVQIEARIERTVPKISEPLVSRGDNFTPGSSGGDQLADFNDIDINTTHNTGQVNQEAAKQVNFEDIVITSEPVAVTIHGGFPDENHFSLSSENLNYELRDALRVPVTALIGDRYSNPVKPGTAVYFETDNGVITGSSEGHTNEEGEATVSLNPGSFGNGTVTATTINDLETEITANINLLFSTSKALISSEFDDTEIVLSPGDDQSVNFTVTDENGNPMAPGTTVEVTADNEGLELSGNTNETVEDALTGGTGITDFTFKVAADEAFSGSTNILISVTSPAGVTSTKPIIVSTSGGVVAGDPEEPASMQLISLSDETINIAESGGTTNATFTFQVQDSAGRNMNSESAVDVEFSILSGPGGGENITPTTARTDAQGRVTSNLNAGDSAGVVQIQAQVVGTSITSRPVAVTIHGGFPVQTNFTVKADNQNYEYTNNLEIPITATLGDTHNNPVKPGTAVYFSTNNGLIEGSAEQHTDEAGRASVIYRPENQGTARITAQTVDENDTEITDDFDLILTTSKATISSDFDSEDIVLAPGESQSVDFTVTDLNGLPMAAGTSIGVSTGNAQLSLSGDISDRIGDATTNGPGISDFTFTVTAGALFDGSSNVTIGVTSPSGVTTSKAIVVNATGGGVTGDPEEPASMELVSLTRETINIAESGGNTNTSFTFQVQDSAGRNMNSESAVDVEFSILSGPGGGENITPATARTDAQGRVTSNLNAGNTAGVVQIQAEVVGTTIKSTPVAVTIHGGFPDQDHFTLEPLTDTNIEGFDKNSVGIVFKVRAGDEFSNPVKPGTAVHFSTTGGVIEGSGTGHTDETGFTEVTLFAGNPRPANGQGVVTAKTTDKDGNDITETEDFIFSTSKALITPDITELELGADESFKIDFEVTDLNGNPMAAGTSIDVISGGSGELTFSGTTSYTMPNELSPGPGSTEFDFTIRASTSFSNSETVKIIVTSPSGVVTTNQELNVYGTGGGVSGVPSGAAAIILENVQHPKINIKETGGIVNTSFTFQVQDSSGRPLDFDNPAEVEFEIIQGPGGGEGILPEVATTNSTGRVTANLFSGNAAGVVQIQAKVERPDVGLTIRSQPVAIAIHGGFPDLDHFSITPASFNFEAYNINGNENVITVIVGDKFSNPVKEGTAVYFETTGGIIEGSRGEINPSEVHTDALGRVEVILLSGEPRPNDGIVTVTASTIDENNQFIEKTVDLVFSTSNAIISANPTTFDLDPNGGESFTYTVTDLNGNPMPEGTTFEIDAGSDIEVTGSSNFTLGDHLNPGPGATEFNFSIRDTDDEINDPADLTIQIKVTSPSGNVTTYDGIQGIRRKISETGTPSNQN